MIMMVISVIYIIAIGSGNLKSVYQYYITVSANNQILVANYGQNCIITFSLDGNCSGRYGTQGTGRGQLKGPCGVAVCLASSLLLSMVIAVYQSLTKMVSFKFVHRFSTSSHNVIAIKSVWRHLHL